MWDLRFSQYTLMPNTIGLGACINGGWLKSIGSDAMLKLGLTHPYKTGL